MKKFASLATAATLALGALAAPAAAAPAAKPDTACMQAGIATLKELGLFSSVARDGLSVEFALKNGVKVRPGANVSGLPAKLPLSVVLADHRAGDDSLLLYPWCK
ncbi:hypothetical protein ACQE98_07825 [Ornithinimicrobium sp. W1679]|uniref:hypothetical protein n=1 Tax=Ornithinimicrobium sp. W1679 TaxID=3418770 RepID=UPI003CEBD2A7